MTIASYKYLFTMAVGLLTVISAFSMTGPADIIPVPVQYSTRTGSIESRRLLKETPTVRLSSRALLRKIGKHGLKDWQLQSAYCLKISKKGAQILAASEEGVFYARQSMLFMALQDSSVACCTVVDWPRFRYRGLMLDVSRNFRSKEFVKKQLDMMSRLKMNRLHLHLDDSAGWRLQIDTYPRLTSYAAWRPFAEYLDWYNKPGFAEQGSPGAHGGFYSKKDIAEIVAYAAKKHIEVIPEIEMPGHNLETIAAYPALSCRRPDGSPAGPSHEVCPGNEFTYEFFQNVLAEVFEMFPSKYIHIGGDEAGKGLWKSCPVCRAKMQEEGLESPEELQSYMIKRIERFANSRGKRIIGWDEILEGGLAPNATVMSWRGTQGGIMAVAAGHDVIFSPTSCYYLDYHQGPHFRAVGAFQPLEKTYAFDPLAEGIPEESAHHVLGVQGNLWTEQIFEEWHAEMMLYPRAFAIAETGWSPSSGKDFGDFMRRAAAWAAVCRAEGYTVYDFEQNTKN